MNPKALNALSARVARLEALLENGDVFKAQGDTTYGGLQFQGSTYNFEAPPPLEQQLAGNFGFGANDMAMFEMQQRIAELEMLVSGGSNDTFQGSALDAGAAVGDDASDGSGTAGGIPAGFTEIPIQVCDGTTSLTIVVLGRV